MRLELLSCHQEERAHLSREPTQKGEPSNAEREKQGLGLLFGLFGQFMSECRTTLGLASYVGQSFAFDLN